jgi:hypothetical protein
MSEELIRKRKMLELKQIEIAIDRAEIELMEHDEKRELMVKNLEETKKRLVKIRGDQ